MLWRNYIKSAAKNICNLENPLNLAAFKCGFLKISPALLGMLLLYSYSSLAADVIFPAYCVINTNA